MAEVGQILLAVRLHHRETCTIGNGPENLPNMCIEDKLGVLQEDVIALERVIHLVGKHQIRCATLV